MSSRYGCGWARIMPGEAGAIGAAWNSFGNCCGNRSKAVGTILQEFPASVTTCAQAFSLLGEELKKRLHAKSVYVSSSSNSTFVINLKLNTTSSNEAIVTLTPANNCNFPIGCSWTRGARKSDGTSSFQTLPDLMNYLVSHLRK